MIASPFGDNPHAHVASLTLPPKPHDVHTSQRFSAPKTSSDGVSGSLSPPAPPLPPSAPPLPLPPPAPPLPPPADGYMQALPQPSGLGGNVNVFA